MGNSKKSNDLNPLYYLRLVLIEDIRKQDKNIVDEELEAQIAMKMLAGSVTEEQKRRAQNLLMWERGGNG